MTPAKRKPRIGRPPGPAKRRTNVTIDPAVLDAVRELAVRERRDFSAQIQLMLERQLAAEQSSTP